MTRYKAEVIVRSYVEFSDDEETEISDQAYDEAVIKFGFADDIEIGEVFVIEETLK